MQQSGRGCPSSVESTAQALLLLLSDLHFSLSRDTHFSLTLTLPHPSFPGATGMWERVHQQVVSAYIMGKGLGQMVLRYRSSCLSFSF